MLTKEIKKMERDYPGKVITGYGTCKFCGQQAACKILEDWTRAEKDEAATESCDEERTERKGEKPYYYALRGKQRRCIMRRNSDGAA